ncbi:hypothetical protein L2Y94_10235 [Luteibacter aegosomatis]|uniref:hypothetical protein n=1 Tax=Luteibacter aegosomatis TaxID=2911537 RepID=UPI001FF8A173|nr:hypothetical protein [Luteibacter aegosomatis]UPG87707.1 hypothetical protein L2Y94_10235 [Luteibacter aegosomatis]
MNDTTSGYVIESTGRRFRIPFGDHLSVVAAYALIYQALYLFMASHWVITEGLRLSCLLLVPRRYWPALAVGELIPVLWKTISHAQKFGTLWAVTSSYPFIVTSMLIVTLMLRRMSLHDRKNNVSVDFLLAVALVSSLVRAIQVNLLSFPGYLSYPEPVQAWGQSIIPETLSFVIGSYLGALTSAPLVLVLHGYLRKSWRGFPWRPLLHDALLLVAPYLTIVVAASRIDTPEARTFAQLAVIVPVVSMTASHGRPGVAAGALLSSIAMHCIFDKTLDPVTMRAEGMLALVITGALVATRPSRPIRTFRSYSPLWLRNKRTFSYFERGLGWARRFRKIGAGGAVLSVLLVVVAATCMVDPTGDPATLYAQTFLTVGISAAWIVVKPVRGNARLAQCEPGRSARIRHAPQRA